MRSAGQLVMLAGFAFACSLSAGALLAKGVAGGGTSC
jgi:hypothetical protein